MRNESKGPEERRVELKQLESPVSEEWKWSLEPGYLGLKLMLGEVV
jgi:hypothetical protein